MLAQIPENAGHKHWMQRWISICAQELARTLGNLRFDDPRDRIDACERALAVLDLIYYDGNKMLSDNNYINIRADLAYNFAEAGEYDNAVAQLNTLAEEMIAADRHPLGSLKYESNRFLDTVCYEHTLQSAHREQLTAVLKESVFEPIRENEQFKNVQKRVDELRSITES